MDSKIGYLHKIFDGDKDKIIEFLCNRIAIVEDTMDKLQNEIIHALHAHAKRSGQVQTSNSKWEE